MKPEDLTGTEIRRRRRALGMTQRQLAEASGVSIRQVQGTEAGQTRPQPANLAAIALALGVDLDGDGDETRRSWPQDVSVFLDIVGAFLVALPEGKRQEWMRRIGASIVTRGDML